MTKESKQYPYSGLVISGGTAAFLCFLSMAMIPLLIATEFFNEALTVILCIFCGILGCLIMSGFVLLEPNQSCVMLFFGKYKGTLTRTGLVWINPLMTKRKMSLRINNLDIAPIKVNDRMGNPINIGMVLVWKVEDTYAASFDVDASGTSRADALRDFVNIQGDAALREVAGHYAYDNDDNSEAITLRSGGDVINELLEKKINERLAIAGIIVVEARINYIAYAPEIAAVMLRRQQASAIISAREKIVEGAVTMVRMALDGIKATNMVDLSEEQKASIVSNLLMVLCSEDGPQTVIPTQN